MSPPEAVPVIVGVGAMTRHPLELAATTEPADLIAAAIAEAAQDAGVKRTVLYGVDSLDVINLLSWKYGDPAGVVAERIGARPARSLFSDFGGEQPTALIDAAAARIQRGEASLAVVAGGETLASRRLWGKSGQEPPWSARGEPPFPIDPLYGVGHGLAEVGLSDPTRIYPLMENAHGAARGLSLAERQASSGRIWAAMSEVASQTAGAWVSEHFSAGEITSPGAANRPIAHPYLKLMCAQPMVDQAAAVIVTSTEVARTLGIDERRWVYPWAAASALDFTEVLDRPTYRESEPLRRSIGDALDLVGLAPGDIGAYELYSCFPIVPKLALEALGRRDTDPATVAGGLTFYGGPLNAYMLCAAVHMVHSLRTGTAPGLLYGNGGYLTKHHTLIVGVDPPADGRYQPDDRRARQADLDRRKAPGVTREPSGTGVIETFTVIYDREGAPQQGVVIGRLDSGEGARFAARVVPDPGVLSGLVSGNDEPIGRSGAVSTDDGSVTFRLI